MIGSLQNFSSIKELNKIKFYRPALELVFLEDDIYFNKRNVDNFKLPISEKNLICNSHKISEFEDEDVYFN